VSLAAHLGPSLATLALATSAYSLSTFDLEVIHLTHPRNGEAAGSGAGTGSANSNSAGNGSGDNNQATNDGSNDFDINASQPLVNIDPTIDPTIK